MKEEIYKKIGQKLYDKENATNRLGFNFNRFLHEILDECCSYYREHKTERTLYKRGGSFIHTEIQKSFERYLFVFNLCVWNFKDKSFFSEENQTYLNFPVIKYNNITDGVIVCNVELPLISGNYMKDSIDILLKSFKREYRNHIISNFQKHFNLNQQNRFNELLYDFRKSNINKCEIIVGDEEPLLDFISEFDDDLQDILISLWLLAMNECASSFKTATHTDLESLRHIKSPYFIYDNINMPFGHYCHRNGAFTTKSLRINDFNIEKIWNIEDSDL